MEIAPLTRYRSTFGASSEDLARPVWRGVVTTANAITYFLPLGEVPKGKGWIKPDETKKKTNRSLFNVQRSTFIVQP
jgi:hypothetical protein